MRAWLSTAFLTFSPAPLLFAAPQQNEPGAVLGRIRLDDLREPFERTLGNLDEFGDSLASLGDINGDGTTELAIGAPGDTTGRGAVWLFSLTNDRRIQRYVKLGPVENLPFTLDAADRFGTSVAPLSDLDGDGVRELAVGAPGDDDGLLPPFGDGGAVYVLFLRGNGTVREFVKLSSTSVFTGDLDAGDSFGTAVAQVGDLDGNGVLDLAVGAPGDDDSENESGAVWLLFFAPDRSVLRVQKLSMLQGGLTGVDANDRFGTALALLGDLSNDGLPELAVGAPRARTNRGDVQLLSLATDVSVAGQTIVPGGTSTTFFGSSLAGLGDLDGDGFEDLAIGALEGQVHVRRLDASGGVVGSVNFGGSPTALAAPGDRNGDGRPDLFVGNSETNLIGGFLVYDLLPTGGNASFGTSFDPTNMGLAVAPRPPDEYGTAIAPIGDLDGNGLSEVAVSAPRDGQGAIWIHYLTGAAGTRVLKVPAPLEFAANFGSSLARLGDLDRDGLSDLAALGDGRLAILFLTAVGRIDSYRVITTGEVGASVAMSEIEPLGDLDGDGNSDLLLRCGQSQVFLLFLGQDGSLRASRRLDLALLPVGDRTRIQDTGFLGLEARSGALRVALIVPGRVHRLTIEPDGDVLALNSRAITLRSQNDGVGLEDLNGDGWSDLARVDRAAKRMRLEFLGPDGALLSERVFTSGVAETVRSLGDLSGDGVVDLAARAKANESAPSHVILFQLGGTATSGFEHQDVAQETPLENGRAIPVPHPGRTFRISSAGANLGAAVFDSALGGPNATSQDPDLLVGSGKVLMLQDSLNGTQSTPGIFDRPNDDRDGGLLAFDFPRPVRALSLELIDIDVGAAVTTAVTLRDERGLTRTYFVLPGFTEDRVADGGSGLRVLRLDTLDPQPGFRATATAAELVGFAPDRVVRVEVERGGSGAVDDLTFDPYP
jgi:hypothetical protein